MRAAPGGPVSSVARALGALMSFSPKLWTVPLVAVSPAEIPLAPALNGCRVLKTAISYANPKGSFRENELNPTQSVRELPCARL